MSFGTTYSLTSEGTREPEVVDRVSSLLCTGCRRATVVVEEQWIGDQPAREGRTTGTVTYRGIHWWPAAGTADLDDSIPEALRDAYAEGARSLGSRSPRAAVAMFRRTLEALVQDRGSPTAKQAAERSLASALSQMARDGTLDRNLAEWATEIRVVGNLGAHFDPLDDVAPEEAESLAKLVRQLLHYVYELPAKIQRTRQGGAVAPNPPR